MHHERASATALRVLEGLVYRATQPETAALVSAEARHAAELLMERTTIGERRLRRLRGPLRLTTPLMEWLLLPGISLQYALRKRWLEEQVRAELVQGASQIIVLGAGMDTLASRLATEFPNDVCCIEVDHPASQAAKAAALGRKKPANLELLGVDFAAQSLDKALGQSTLFKGDVRSVVVCEGVWAYLDERDVQAMLQSLRAVLPSESAFLFTFLTPPSRGKSDFGPLLKLYLSLASESVRFQMVPEELGEFLRDAGFELECVVSSPELLEAYGCDYDGAVHELEVQAAARL